MGGMVSSEFTGVVVPVTGALSPHATAYRSRNATSGGNRCWKKPRPSR